MDLDHDDTIAGDEFANLDTGIAPPIIADPQLAWSAENPALDYPGTATASSNAPRGAA